MSRIGSTFRSRKLRYPFHYYPSEHEQCFLEIHFGCRPIFIPMAMNLLCRDSKVFQFLLSDPPALPEQAISLQDLGSNPMAIQNGIKRAKRGLEDSTVTIVFPGQSTHPTVSGETKSRPSGRKLSR